MANVDQYSTRCTLGMRYDTQTANDKMVHTHKHIQVFEPCPHGSGLWYVMISTILYKLTAPNSEEAFFSAVFLDLGRVPYLFSTGDFLLGCLLDEGASPKTSMYVSFALSSVLGY